MNASFHEKCIYVLMSSQSPVQSGDEGDGEGTTAGVAETLIKPDGAGSTEMPSVIAAES